MSGAFLLLTLVRKLIHSTSQLTASIGNFIKHSSHIGRAAIPTLFKEFTGGHIYWEVFYFLAVVSTAVVLTAVESTCTESTTTAVESTQHVSSVSTFLQETKTVDTNANTKNTFFIFLFLFVN